MEFYTGSVISIMSCNNFKTLFPQNEISKYKTAVRTYTNEVFWLLALPKSKFHSTFH